MSAANIGQCHETAPWDKSCFAYPCALNAAKLHTKSTPCMLRYLASMTGSNHVVQNSLARSWKHFPRQLAGYARHEHDSQQDWQSAISNCTPQLSLRGSNFNNCVILTYSVGEGWGTLSISSEARQKLVISSLFPFCFSTLEALAKNVLASC